MSIIFAKIFGIYFLSIGLSFVINPDLFKRYAKLVKDEGFMTLGAIMALVFGATVISLHNIWSFEWQVFITLLGWWSLIKGFGIMAYPGYAKYLAHFFNRSETFYRGIGVMWIVIGLFFIYHGWF
jgi:uncharacterized protein YjeT (DUF2065 family)